MKCWLTICGIVLCLAACGLPLALPPESVTPTVTPAVVAPTSTSTAVPTATASPGAKPPVETSTVTPLPAATTPPTVPPTPTVTPLDDRKLLAWAVAADGAVFALDAAYTVYQLSPADLAPLARSAPLFQTGVEAPAYLLADETHLFVGSSAVTQTVVLERGQAGALDEVARFDQAGPMAVDPGKWLFMVPQDVPHVPFESVFWAYDLGDLSRPPAQVELSCIAPRDLTADPTARRLYVRMHSICASPPHAGESYASYDLDTLQELGQSTPELGELTRPAVARQSDSLVGVLYAFNGNHKLFITDRQGRELKSYSPPDGLPATDAPGQWIYLLRRQGLWTLKADDLALQSVLPFTGTPPANLALSPDGATLYLWGNGWRTATAAAALRDLGFPPISRFPATWFGGGWRDYAQPRLYLSPGMDEDGVAFVQVLVGDFGIPRETYRSTDGGRSWRLFLPLTYPLTITARCLSLSPGFATDKTLTAPAGLAVMRSTDGGETWQTWRPRLAFVSERDGNRELYTMERMGEDVRRLTDSPAAEENPAWSPAWTRLAFQSNRNGNWDIFDMRADCDPSSPDTEKRCDLRRLTDDPADDMLPAWSPDGQAIAFVSTRDGCLQ